MVDVAEVDVRMSIQGNDRLTALNRYFCPNQDCESNQGTIQRFFVNLGVCPFCGVNLKKANYMVPY